MIKNGKYNKRWIIASVILISSCILTTNQLQSTEYQKKQSMDYDPVTGEPICINCHTGDKKTVIDYTKDSQCLACHESEHSQRFLSIDQRYKVPVSEATRNYRYFAQAENRKKKAALKSAKSFNPGLKNKSPLPKDMVLVPAGTFTMGSDGWWPKSGPSHKRDLPGFLIDKFEVTNAAYLKFYTSASPEKSDHWPKHWPKVWIKGIPDNLKKHPVTNINWFSAQAYCQWKKARLPTEAEWEKAARGTDGRVFPWGNEFDKKKANTPQFGHGSTMPVGQFENGKSPYGAYDMAGNVFEWTSDWYKAYPGNQHPDGNEGEKFRVVRGGSFYDCTFYKCGISSPTFNRIFFNPHTKSDTFGFRCAKSLDK